MGLSFNTAAAQALSLLSGVTRAYAPAPTRATGLKVEQTSDNMAYWSIATTMKADGLSLSSAEEATGRAAAIVDVAVAGVIEAATVLDDIRVALVSAKSPGADRQRLGDRIEDLKARLFAAADGAGFDGENWLSLPAGQSPNVETVVASVSRSSGGDLSVNVIDFDTATSSLVSRQSAADGILTRGYTVNSAGAGASGYFLLDAGSVSPVSGATRPIMLSAETSSDEVIGMIAAVDLMRRQVAEAGAALRTTGDSITQNIDFDEVRDTVELKVGRSMEADLDAEAVIRKALETSAQLQAQALSIVNTEKDGSFSLVL